MLLDSRRRLSARFLCQVPRAVAAEDASRHGWCRRKTGDGHRQDEYLEGGKSIVLSVKASELRKSFLERANKGDCGIGSILV